MLISLKDLVTLTQAEIGQDLNASLEKRGTKRADREDICLNEVYVRYFYKDLLSETRQIMFSECLNCTRNHWVFNKCVEDEILAVTLKRHYFFAPLLMNFWLIAWSFLNCWEAEKGVYKITEICHK